MAMAPEPFKLNVKSLADDGPFVNVTVKKSPSTGDAGDGLSVHGELQVAEYASPTLDSVKSNAELNSFEPHAS